MFLFSKNYIWSLNASSGLIEHCWGILGKLSMGMREEECWEMLWFWFTERERCASETVNTLGVLVERAPLYSFGW